MPAQHPAAWPVPTGIVAAPAQRGSSGGMHGPRGRRGAGRCGNAGSGPAVRSWRSLPAFGMTKERRGQRPPPPIPAPARPRGAAASPGGAGSHRRLAPERSRLWEAASCSLAPEGSGRGEGRKPPTAPPASRRIAPLAAAASPTLAAPAGGFVVVARSFSCWATLDRPAPFGRIAGPTLAQRSRPPRAARCGGILARRSALPQTIPPAQPPHRPASQPPQGGFVVVARSFSCRATPHRTAPAGQHHRTHPPDNHPPRGVTSVTMPRFGRTVGGIGVTTPAPRAVTGASPRATPRSRAPPTCWYYWSLSG